jgi:hypothetical protein
MQDTPAGAGPLPNERTCLPAIAPGLFNFSLTRPQFSFMNNRQLVDSQ